MACCNIIIGGIDGLVYFTKYWGPGQRAPGLMYTGDRIDHTRKPGFTILWYSATIYQ